MLALKLIVKVVLDSVLVSIVCSALLRSVSLATLKVVVIGNPFAAQFRRFASSRETPQQLGVAQKLRRWPRESFLLLPQCLVRYQKACPQPSGCRPPKAASDSVTCVNA